MKTLGGVIVLGALAALVCHMLIRTRTTNPDEARSLMVKRTDSAAMARRAQIDEGRKTHTA